jgi:hypothetical protein
MSAARSANGRQRRERARDGIRELVDVKTISIHEDAPTKHASTG